MIHALIHRRWKRPGGAWFLELLAFGDERFIGACYRRLVEAGVNRNDIQMSPLEADAPFWHDALDGRNYACAGVGSLEYCNEVQRRLLGEFAVPETAPMHRDGLFLVVRREDSTEQGRPHPLDVRIVRFQPGIELWFGATLSPGLTARFREECREKAVNHA